MANQPRRVVIIGAGHNGLVAAFHLAKAGFAPLVLERREIVGGVAATEEIHPGFRCPAVLHVAGPLLPEVRQAMGLRNGGQASDGQESTVVLGSNGQALKIPARNGRPEGEISTRDSEKYSEFHSCFSRLGAAVRPLLLTTPPDIDNLNLGDYLNLGRLGLKLRGLDRKDAYRLLRWGPMSVADLAAEWFDGELMQAAVAARGIFGAFAGPRSAGTTAGLLMQAAFGESPISTVAGVAGLADALAKAATTAGAQIRTKANVTRIRVKDGEVVSVVLETGEEITSNAVVSNADPRRTFMQLIDATELDPGFLTKVRSYRCAGVVAKVNLALSGLPAFPAPNASRIQIGPSIDYIERAFDAAKYGEFSPEPYLDVTIPSIADPSLAPNGAHVMSVHVQYAPYALKKGDWKMRREELGDVVVDTLARYAGNLRGLIVQRQVITPLDLEETYGLTGGHIFHGEHALDQLFAFRPFLGWAQYRTPIHGLYLCGSGTHPAGGITGAPGTNASREIIKDLKSRG